MSRNMKDSLGRLFYLHCGLLDDDFFINLSVNRGVALLSTLTTSEMDRQPARSPLNLDDQKIMEEESVCVSTALPTSQR